MGFDIVELLRKAAGSVPSNSHQFDLCRPARCKDGGLGSQATGNVASTGRIEGGGLYHCMNGIPVALGCC